jgi:hypothetical protein
MSKSAHERKRQDKWQDAEDSFLMYMPEKENDRLRKEARSSGRPQYTTISIPYSYAMLMTSHTYYTSVFLARNPILQLQGRHGEAQTAEMAMESLLDYQLSTGGLAPLFVWLLDVGKYGHGVLGHYWDEEDITVTESVLQPKMFLGVPLPGTEEAVSQTRTVKGFVGNRLYNVRPQDFFNDPRLPLGRFQEGEYCITYDKVGWNKIQRGKAAGRYYNVERIKKEKYASGEEDTNSGTEFQSPRDDLDVSQLEDTKPAWVSLYEFYWEIVPSEWGLSSSTQLEKWVFVIANKTTVISAQPLGLRHGKYPFDVIELEIDGYAIYNRGMLEILQPLNETIEWLFNSHFFNVRSALNNQFVVDPSRVVTKDLEDPNPGKLIRLKPAAYGSSVRDVVTQLPVSDITRANLSDVDVVGSIAQRILGVTDNVMGMVNAGGRKTATEVRSSTTFSVNRLKTTCEWFSTTGFTPLTQKLVVSTQQLYSLERKYRIVGDMAQWAERYINITPDDIQGFFDFTPVDGTMPVDRFAQANLWNQLLGTISRMPGIAMSYDLPKIFGFIAQLSGIKNINQFRVQVVPDAQLAAQAQAGNQIPMRTNLSEPGQIPGMGSTG